MLFFTLNVLSPVKKNKLEQLIHFLFTKNILEIALLFLAILASTYVWGWLVLSQVFNDLSQSSLLVSRDRLGYNQEIKSINLMIKEVDLASQDYAALTPKLIELTTSTPANVKFVSLTLDRRKKNLTLAGTAKTRADLLAFEQALHAIPWIEKTTTPLSQLLTQTDINFQITAVLKNFPPLRNDSILPRARSVE